MKHKGFTLLESLVALVILSTAFAFVWEWFGTAVITSGKIETAVELPIIYDQAQAHLSSIDLHEVSEGSFKVNNYLVKWKAQQVRSSITEPYRKSPAWIVGLFDVELIFKKNQKVITSTKTQIVKQWRDDTYVPLSL